jgi:hypothetical protein
LPASAASRSKRGLGGGVEESGRAQRGEARGVRDHALHGGRVGAAGSARAGDPAGLSRRLLCRSPAGVGARPAAWAAA